MKALVKMPLLFVFLALGSPMMAAEFTGTASGLEGEEIPTFKTLTVEVSVAGRSVGSPTTINLEKKTYTVTVDNAIFQGRNKDVTLIYRADQRETVTLTNILGLNNQRIDVVMPEKNIVCDSIDCCPAKRWHLFGHWRN